MADIMKSLIIVRVIFHPAARLTTCAEAK